jgi:hypothetical protein
MYLLDCLLAFPFGNLHVFARPFTRIVPWNSVCNPRLFTRILPWAITRVRLEEWLSFKEKDTMILTHGLALKSRQYNRKGEHRKVRL